MSKDFSEKLEALADNYNIPSIVDWKQGKFIDQPKYSRMPDEWKNKQINTEKTIIRPYGFMDNAIFQVSNSENNAKVAEYLEALGKLIKDNL